MKLFVSKVVMRLHIAAKHRGVKYNCKDCPKVRLFHFDYFLTKKSGNTCRGHKTQQT